ncbi:MAG: HK97 family phage prohead protease [Beijerinckiaceae bacterium]
MAKKTGAAAGLPPAEAERAPEAPMEGTRRADTPAGWKPGQVESRFVGAKPGVPSTYDAKARTVEVVIATDYRVRRWYGYEELAISETAIDLRRVALGQCRLLDSHNRYGTDAALGVVLDARIQNGQLVGTVRFNDSDAGRKAEQSVARGEITGISAGYRVNKLVLAETSDDDDDVYRVEQWELQEVSLVSVPADPFSGARSDGGAPPLPPASPQPAAGISVIEAARARMRLAAAAIKARIIS